MTKEERAADRERCLAACRRMRQTQGRGPDVRQFVFDDVECVRAGYERMSAEIDRLEAELAATKESLKGTFRYGPIREMKPMKWDETEE